MHFYEMDVKIHKKLFLKVAGWCIIKQMAKQQFERVVSVKEERKYFIDNLRNITILLLFPVHTFMIWNDFGGRFYIWLGENKILSTLIVLVNPWFMPLLFVLAGVSARYALLKRTKKEFIVERIKKLLIPFISGLAVLVPFQALYARKFFDNYGGGIPGHWKYFFTHITDFSGYDGAFTPGHLWFILFLFIISLVALEVTHLMPYEKVSKYVGKMPVLAVFLLFVPIWLMYYLGNFGGYSIGKNFALYLVGYYVLSNDAVIRRLEKCWLFLAIVFAIVTFSLVVLYYNFSYYGDLWVNFIGWISILALFIGGKKILNSKTGFTEYFNKASYPVYILHQTILVVLAYYLVQINDNTLIQVLCICIGTFLLTVLAYHVAGLVPFFRKAAGIK
ncbi:MAG: acyltransferase [Lachnospiraceae bacterium]|nr:acyltransferase [Lachnospiraceae bacterium]